MNLDVSAPSFSYRHKKFSHKIVDCSLQFIEGDVQRYISAIDTTFNGITNFQITNANFMNVCVMCILYCVPCITQYQHHHLYIGHVCDSMLICINLYLLELLFLLSFTAQKQTKPLQYLALYIYCVFTRSSVPNRS